MLEAVKKIRNNKTILNFDLKSFSILAILVSF